MTSLLDTDKQMPLLSTADMPAALFEETESQGEYTAERLFKFQRDRYDLICRMLSEGMSNISISRIAKCAEKTVAAVRTRELALLPMPDVKVAMSQRWAGTFHIAQDIMAEIAADPKRRAEVSFKDAAIAGSIATQNHQLLTGDATSRVEYVEPGTSEHNDLNAYLQSLRSAKPPQAELPAVVDVEATTNSPQPSPEPAQVTRPQSQAVTDPIPS